MNQIKVIQFIIPETNIERRSLRRLEPSFRGRVLALEKGGTDRTKREADRLESLLQSLLIAFLLEIVYPTRSDECLKDIICFAIIGQEFSLHTISDLLCKRCRNLCWELFYGKHLCTYLNIIKLLKVSLQANFPKSSFVSF